MHRRLLPFAALAFPAVAHAHDTGVEVLYAAAELLLLIVMLGVIAALRKPWRRRLAALLVLAVATAIFFALGQIPLEGASAWLEPTTWACIPLGSIGALVVLLRRAAPPGRR